MIINSTNIALNKALAKPLKPMPNDRLFFGKLIAWVDAHNSADGKMPHNRKTLWEVRFLELSGTDITSIPEDLGKLTNLMGLLLSNNQLTEIPDCLSNMTNLSVLDLDNNQLTEISEHISKLTNLITLDLSNNKLTEIPEQLSNLKNLIVLNLSDNKLTEIPKYLSKFTNLTVLRLDNNQLTKIPEYLSKLTNLTALNLSNNQLTEIPDCIRNMPNLEIIGLDEQLPQTPPEKSKMTYQQKILFGSPGTGKSHKIDNSDKNKNCIIKELGITNRENVIKTVFHPEYTYGDFIGKLVPTTPRSGGNAQYLFYEGHFLKALAQAYKNIIAAHNENEKIENVALVIDEINRGNSAAIFGTTFQLLDRNPDGWSSYDVSVNEITFTRLFELCDLKPHSIVQGKIMTYKFGNEEIPATTLQTKLNCHFENRTIKTPPNLSILASMNTSDSSIYYMDSAFKRRWQWEFIDIDGTSTSETGVAFQNRAEWIVFVGKLNTFIKSNHKYIRGIEDKQIGYYFITDEQIQKSTIQNKLMFFLWDSVFNRDKKPLITLLFGDNKDDTLITFGDFAKRVNLFIEKINSL